MFFRNLTLFRFSAKVAAGLDGLDAALDGHRLRPCGPIELATRGFVSPLGRREEPLTHSVGRCTLISIGAEEKLLPVAVVNEELARRIQKIVEEEGRRIGGRERKRLKQEVLDELLPRAFVRPSQLSAYLDKENGWLVLDTASRKAAEAGLTALREALGSFPAVPLAPEETPRALMTDWLAHGKLPAGLRLGDECELRDPATATGAVVRCRRQDLESDEVREHLKGGKQVFQLGLEYDGRVSFVLGEDLVLRKLRFLDGVLDELEADDRDSAQAELDARFALMTLEFDRLLAQLSAWFGLPRPGDDA
ncbi:MAG: recombination-associated protein RdgC [Mizugakiibacter sp.]|uniref:recombination-associated protein RdgC n=1 Tax=Mizugakiibacter sp. TaxID=1972610 RepID=UPI0031BEAEA9|nr:recombination-associated protein RdgC [Xanthomonadaceae bacterium]